MMLNLTDYETATLLAALRHWQRHLENADSLDEWEIATDGDLDPMSSHEIDKFCERLNMEE